MNTDDAEFIDHEINDLIEDENTFENHKTIIKEFDQIDKKFKKLKKQLRKAENALENAVEIKFGFYR